MNNYTINDSHEGKDYQFSSSLLLVYFGVTWGMNKKCISTLWNFHSEKLRLGQDICIFNMLSWWCGWNCLVDPALTGTSVWAKTNHWRAGHKWFREWSLQWLETIFIPIPPHLPGIMFIQLTLSPGYFIFQRRACKLYWGLSENLHILNNLSAS